MNCKTLGLSLKSLGIELMHIYYTYCTIPRVDKDKEECESLYLLIQGF